MKQSSLYLVIKTVVIGVHAIIISQWLKLVVISSHILVLVAHVDNWLLLGSSYLVYTVFILLVHFSEADG